MTTSSPKYLKADFYANRAQLLILWVPNALLGAIPAQPRRGGDVEEKKNVWI